MKKNHILLTAAAICALAACSKVAEQEIPAENTPADEPQVTEWTYISALGGEENVDGSSKASINGTTAAFTWNTGDKIAVYSGDKFYFSQGLDASYNGTNDAEFAFAGSINADRKFFAVYPASLVSENSSCSDNSISISLPGSYKYSEVKNDLSPTPMIAANAPDGSLAFKSICALVRVHVLCVPKDAYTIRITFPGKKVHGEFTLSNFSIGADGVATTTTDGNDDTITITDLGISTFSGINNGPTINVPIPIGVASSQEYLYIRVGAYDSMGNKINSIDTPLKVVSSVPTNWAPGRLTSRKVTAKLPYFTTNGKTNKRVVLAPGNLVATLTVKPTSDTNPTGDVTNWRFAEHQYDALGDYSGNKFQNVGDDIDLFAWIGASATYDYESDSNTNAKYGILYPVSDRTVFCGNVNAEKIKYNWADIFNGVTYPAGTWRLPNNDREGGDSANEWNRIASTRTPEGGSSSYVSAKATIKNGDDVVARGLILFPNNYTHPYGVKTLVNYTRAAMPASHWADNEITLTEWDILEKVGGCAFLPVTSARWRNSGSNTSDYFGDLAYWNDYATSTTHAGAMMVSDADYCAKSLLGNGSTNFSGAKSCDRRNGCAVRLIRDVD